MSKGWLIVLAIIGFIAINPEGAKKLGSEILGAFQRTPASVYYQLKNN